MLIVDYPVTKFYWEPIFKRICRCFTTKNFTHVQGDIYLMWMRKARIYVAATEEDGCYSIYGWYYLIQQKDWAAWEIYQSYIFKDHRGHGWGKKIMDAVINKERLMLASGPQQTHHARKLWKGIVAKDAYTVWAHDFKNLFSFAPVTYDPDNDTLDCSLPIYDVASTPERDVRLIAIRKSHDNGVRNTGGNRSTQGLSVR